MDTAQPRAHERTIGQVSFSRLEVVEHCPYRGFLAYVERRPEPSTINRSHADRGSLVHAEAEKYVRGEIAVLPPELSKDKIVPLLNGLREKWDGSQNVEVEQEWAFDRDWKITGWRDKTCWLRIKCDVVEHDDIPHVIDWKTGKSFGNEVKHSQQGLLYGGSTIMRYPDAPGVKVTFAYTDENKVKSKVHTREALARLLPTFDKRLKKASDMTVFPARPSKITCRFCPYSPNNGGDSSCPWGVEV